jgi:hypothetical protein
MIRDVMATLWIGFNEKREIQSAQAITKSDLRRANSRILGGHGVYLPQMFINH